MINQYAYALGDNSSIIRDLSEYGRERAAIVGEENVFDFSIGNPSAPPPRQVADTIRQLLSEADPILLHSYTPAVGDYEARKAIAEDLNARFDAGAGPEDFFIGCGAAPELAAVLGALAVSGGEVLAIAPYFPEYKPIAETAGLLFKAIPPDVPAFQINFEALEPALAANTQALILNSPNNPTGVVYSRATLEKLGALLSAKSREFGHPIYLISDEPYRELTYGYAAPWVPHFYPNTVVVYSWSKCLSLPGERIGYVYVPKEAAQAKELCAAISGAARAMGHVCAPSLWQKVIAKCAHLRSDFTEYDRNRRTLCEGLAALGYEMAPPEGAFYLFVKDPDGDAVAFMEKAKKKDLLIVPGDGFGCPGWFRLCYCVSHEKVQKSLPIFASLIEKGD